MSHPCRGTRSVFAALFLIPLVPTGAMLGAATSPKAREHPASVDLRPQLARWGLAPRRQGKRNTCSAFVVTGALEFALAKRESRGTRLSVEFLNWASNDVLGQARDGGFFSDLWKGFEAYGICPEEAMPYAPSFRPETEPSKKALALARGLKQRGFRLHWIKAWNPRNGLTDGQLAEVRKTLARGFPVCGGFLWPKKAVWKDKVLQICPRKDVRDGHSVLLVGYRDDAAKPGGGVFIVRDTSKDGPEGFLTYEYLKTYMNDAAWIDPGVASESGPTWAPPSTTSSTRGRT